MNTDLLPYGVEHLMSKVIPADQILYPPDVAKDDLRWGFRLNRPDFTSSHDYRWPFPGNWAVAPGPILDHDDECCRKVGDGICAAHTLGGASSNGARVGTTVGLLVAWTEPDVLGCSEDKVRLRRAWVAAVFDPATSLRGADLRDAYLQDADLRGADLRGADLRDAHLQGADLRGAELRGADLRDADLRDAHLRDAHLRDADLRDAYLQDADLRGADLQGADLRDAHLQGADLRDADLQGADLRGAELRGADLEGAYPQGAYYSSSTVWPAGLDPAAAGGVEL